MRFLMCRLRQLTVSDSNTETVSEHVLRVTARNCLCSHAHTINRQPFCHDNADRLTYLFWFHIFRVLMFSLILVGATLMIFQQCQITLYYIKLDYVTLFLYLLGFSDTINYRQCYTSFYSLPTCLFLRHGAYDVLAMFRFFRFECVSVFEYTDHQKSTVLIVLLIQIYNREIYMSSQ